MSTLLDDDFDLLDDDFDQDNLRSIRRVDENGDIIRQLPPGLSLENTKSPLCRTQGLRYSAIGRAMKIDPVNQLKCDETIEPATSLGIELKKCTELLSKQIYEGVYVYKLTKNGKKKKVFTMSKGNFLFFLTPSKVNNNNEKFNGSFQQVKSRILNHGNSKNYHIPDIQHVYTGFVGTMRLERYFDSLQITSSTEREDLEKQILIIVLGGFKTLNLLIPNQFGRESIHDALLQLKRTYDNKKIFVPKEDILLRYVWYDVDKDKSGTISKKEMKNMFNRLNVENKFCEKDFENYCQSIGAEDKMLSFKDCMSYLNQMKIPSNRKTSIESQIWEDVFGDVEYVSKMDFLVKFLVKTQKQTTAMMDDVTVIFEYLHMMDISAQVETPPKNMINRIQFEEYLFSSFNAAYDQSVTELQENSMFEPMSHYYINSSHNTYLTGDQFQSYSSVQMYLEALQRGCVCVEIDTWDGYLEKDEHKTPVPIVYHGYTRTSKIRFIDIIKCINGFLNTYPESYPIILSFENHCSRPYNEEIARTLMEVLGDKLYKPNADTDFCGKIRCPGMLRGKVVVKGKRPPEPDLTLTVDDIIHLSPKKRISIRKAEEYLENEKDAAQKLFDRIAPELADITLLHGVKHKNFELSLKQENFFMHAISEAKHFKLVNDDIEGARLWREYNVDHMTRTYPKAARLDSSNYDCMIPFAMGCQMVALNFQTKSKAMMINDGLFVANGRCGYVLKPDWLRDPEKLVFDGKPLKLKIQIIRGSCLSGAKSTKETINPFVKVTLHDVDIAIDANHKEDENGNKSERGEKYGVSFSTSFKTEATKSNGYCPVWKEHEWNFDVLNKDIAILNFKVGSDSSSTLSSPKVAVKKVTSHLAFASIPVRFLCEGYRHVRLYGRFGETGATHDCSSLLVKVKFVGCP